MKEQMLTRREFILHNNNMYKIKSLASIPFKLNYAIIRTLRKIAPMVTEMNGVLESLANELKKSKDDADKVKEIVAKQEEYLNEEISVEFYKVTEDAWKKIENCDALTGDLLETVLFLAGKI